ncbi:MAG: hypothetical protein J6J12_07875 [Oscillospiraceae bacterium]|nr:hypothetical protein [Oscillospiraceae bacterium]
MSYEKSGRIEKRYAYQIKNNVITGNPETGDNILFAAGVMAAAVAVLVCLFLPVRKKGKYLQN